MKTEKQLQKFITKTCKKKGIFCQKTESRSARGFPDLLLAKHGNVVFLELKTPAGTGRLSALQVARIREMRDVGMDVWVVDSVEVADEIMDDLFYGD